MIYVFVPLLSIFVGIALFFVYLALTEYRPEPIEDSDSIRNSRDEELTENIKITTLNMGYCSLDKDQDFFLEGGSSKHTTRDETFDNLISLTSQLKELNSDFYLLQEVDVKGTRSNNINQVEYIATEANQYNLFYAYNYRAKWVPLPVFKPMGSAYSGLLTLSKKQFKSSKRYQLEGQELFPKSMFFPKRAFVVNEFVLQNKKTLYLINVHLSAYDKDAQYRSLQVAHLVRFIRELYSAKENYVIIGGDFNLLLDKNLYQEDMPSWVVPFDENILGDDFKVVFDPKINTVRSDDRPYIKGLNFETIIDGFIVSKNIKNIKVQTSDWRFEHTDHNPVTLLCTLK
jgi:endonuclease/exonuclease/phosphatase family metal-dependent hydrolase